LRRAAQTESGLGFAGLAQAMAMGGEHVAAGNHPLQFASLAVEHREAADVVVDHVIGGLAEGAIGIDDFWGAFDQLAQMKIRGYLESQQIPPREYAEEMSISIQNRKSLMSRARRAGGDPLTHALDGVVGIEW